MEFEFNQEEIEYKESEVHDEIWENRDQFINKIDDYNFSPLNEMDGLIEKLLSEIFENSTRRIYEDFKSTEFIAKDIPLDKDDDSSIRPDFLGIPEGVNGIWIGELKKSKQTERQAFTQLLAYANHFVSLFPFLTKDDICFLLIAPMKERITREAFLYSLLFDKKPIIALQPYLTSKDDLSSIRFKPWIPTKSDFARIKQRIFSARNFTVLKVCWSRSSLVNPDDNGEIKSYHQAKMDAVAANIAQTLEERGIFGFVYSSQKYSESLSLYSHPNALVIVAINPYAPEISEANYLSTKIPALNKFYEKKDDHYLDFLCMSWGNSIFRMVCEMLELAFDKCEIEINDLGDFESYQSSMVEDIMCFNHKAFPVGAFRELYQQFLKKPIEELEEFYHTDDIPVDKINMFHHQGFIRDFIDMNLEEEILEDSSL